jgi:hypothetical protein
VKRWRERLRGARGVDIVKPETPFAAGGNHMNGPTPIALGELIGITSR